VDEIIRLVTEKLGVPADKIRSFLPTLLGYVRQQVPQNLVSKYDEAVGTTPDQTAEATDVTAKAQESGLSLDQLKSVLDTVLNFLKSKLPADAFEQISGKLGSLLSGGGLAGLLQKVAGMFGGKS
jgi:hypothetical protein